MLSSSLRTRAWTEVDGGRATRRAMLSPNVAVAGPFFRVAGKYEAALCCRFALPLPLAVPVPDCPTQKPRLNSTLSKSQFRPPPSHSGPEMRVISLYTACGLLAIIVSHTGCTAIRCLHTKQSPPHVIDRRKGGDYIFPRVCSIIVFILSYVGGVSLLRKPSGKPCEADELVSRWMSSSGCACSGVLLRL